MKISAVISDLSCPPREGLHQQSLLLLSELQKYAEVDIYCFCRDLSLLDVERLRAEYGITLTLSPVPDRVPSVVRGLLSRLPRRFQPSRLKAVLDRIHGPGAGVLYLEGAAAAGLVRREFAKSVMINIVDPPSHRQKRLLRDSRGHLPKVVKHWIGYALSMFLESSVNYPGISWNVVSTRDRDYLKGRLGSETVSAIPVMVPHEIANAEVQSKESNAPLLAVVYADLRLEHMRSAFAQMMENISNLPSDKLAQLKLSVLGRVEKDEFLLDSCKGVDVTFFPYVNDYIKFLVDFDVVLLPDTVGTGIKNRAVQGMALGRAVLGTKTAFEGIEAIDNVHSIVVDNPELIANRLVQLIENPTDCRRLGVAARSFVLENFAPPAVTRRWLEELRKLEA